jgi:hypothetical protein
MRAWRSESGLTWTPLHVALEPGLGDGEGEGEEPGVGDGVTGGGGGGAPPVPSTCSTAETRASILATQRSSLVSARASGRSGSVGCRTARGSCPTKAATSTAARRVSTRATRRPSSRMRTLRVRSAPDAVASDSGAFRWRRWDTPVPSKAASRRSTAPSSLPTRRSSSASRGPGARAAAGMTTRPMSSVAIVAQMSTTRPRELHGVQRPDLTREVSAGSSQAYIG